jgi:hypothetical protein
VALAGREAVALTHPQIATRWKDHEATDVNTALQQIGYRFPEVPRALIDPEYKRQADQRADEALALIAVSARERLSDPMAARALRALAEHLISCGRLEIVETNSGPAMVFLSEVSGQDAQRVIDEARIRRRDET